MEEKAVKVKDSAGYIVFKIINTIFMILICVMTLYPFLYLVAQSFSSEVAISQGIVSILPVGFNIETYKSVLEKGDFISSYKNILALIYKEKCVYSFIYTTLFTFALDKIFDFAIASKLWFYLLCLPTILLMLINIALSGIRCFKYILKKLVSIIKK